MNISEINQAVQKESLFLQDLKREIAKVIVGQEDLIDKILVAIIADGHILIEGVPGLAKTLTVKTLAEAISGSFQRIQFTPDLLPADVTGTLVFNPKEGSFSVRKGPVFANLILDSRCYIRTTKSQEWEHNGGTGVANNYVLSSIRLFLIQDFYNIAFNNYQQNIMLETTVANSFYDKLFLLSHEEITRDYNKMVEMTTGASDYSCCQGLKMVDGKGNWWLRSPGDYSSDVIGVNSDGTIDKHVDVYFNYYGVRPACWIKEI